MVTLVNGDTSLQALALLFPGRATGVPCSLQPGEDAGESPAWLPG